MDISWMQVLIDKHGLWIHEIFLLYFRVGDSEGWSGKSEGIFLLLRSSMLSSACSRDTRKMQT